MTEPQKTGFTPIQKIAIAAVLKVLLIGAIVFFVVTSVMAKETRVVPSNKHELQLSYSPLVKQAAPAVVNIFTRKTVVQKQRRSLFNDPFFEQFFGRSLPQKKKKKTQNSLGSGVLVSADGVVITNYHVIAGADEITVALNDRREFDAKLILEDEQTDLAVLKITSENEKFPYLEFHNSDELEVGDLVLAIGNPFGVGQTVTSGIVSALDRSAGGKTSIENFIQTDAAINPGNSGGALLTMKGTLAGINSAIFSKSGGSLGIGFAIPSNLVQSVLENGLTNGRVVRPWLGANGQAITQELATGLGMERPTGVLISDIYKGSAADVSGIRINDIVATINGYEVVDMKSVLFRMSTGRLGEKAEFGILRGGEELALQIPLMAAPRDPAPSPKVLTGPQPMAGAVVANLSPALAQDLRMSPFIKGVVVTDVQRGSIAARQGFRKRDVLTEINGQDVEENSTVQSMLDGAQEGWEIILLRNGRKAVLRLSR